MMPPAEDGGLSRFVWFKAERLSSGVRSANRPETVCVKGAGCVATWAEDPEGIRPGEGEAPGEGWSGAFAHHQTDTWYSYIDWDAFDLPSGAEDNSYGTFYGEDLTTSGASLAAWVAANEFGTPSAAVPMSVPMRLTDNAMCTADDSKPYCLVDYDGSRDRRLLRLRCRRHHGDPRGADPGRGHVRHRGRPAHARQHRLHPGVARPARLLDG